MTRHPYAAGQRSERRSDSDEVQEVHVRGFTAIEIAVLFLMMVVVVALALVLAPTPEIHVSTPTPEIHLNSVVKIDGERFGEELYRGLDKAASAATRSDRKTECMNNVRKLVGLLTNGDSDPLRYSGVNLILMLIKRGDLEGENSLKLLYCPGDARESLEMAGGAIVYGPSLDIKKQGEHEHLSSYAGRVSSRNGCRVPAGSRKPVVLICDDSADHHNGEGYVLGYSDGSVKFRHKFDDWKLDVETEVMMGPDSVVPELRCLRSD